MLQDRTFSCTFCFTNRTFGFIVSFIDNKRIVVRCKTFRCPHCAVEAISLLTVKVSDGEQAGFGNYRSYKLDYSEKFYQTIH